MVLCKGSGGTSADLALSAACAALRTKALPLSQHLVIDKALLHDYDGHFSVGFIHAHLGLLWQTDRQQPPQGSPQAMDRLH